MADNGVQEVSIPQTPQSPPQKAKPTVSEDMANQAKSVKEQQHLTANKESGQDGVNSTGNEDAKKQQAEIVEAANEGLESGRDPGIALARIAEGKVVESMLGAEVVGNVRAALENFLQEDEKHRKLAHKIDEVFQRWKKDVVGEREEISGITNTLMESSNLGEKALGYDLILGQLEERLNASDDKEIIKAIQNKMEELRKERGKIVVTEGAEKKEIKEGDEMRSLYKLISGKDEDMVSFSDIQRGVRDLIEGSGEEREGFFNRLTENMDDEEKQQLEGTKPNLKKLMDMGTETSVQGKATDMVNEVKRNERNRKIGIMTAVMALIIFLFIKRASSTEAK